MEYHYNVIFEWIGWCFELTVSWGPANTVSYDLMQKQSAMLLLPRLFFIICGRIYNKLDLRIYDWVSRCIKSAFCFEIYTVNSRRIEIK